MQTMLWPPCAEDFRWVYKRNETTHRHAKKRGRAAGERCEVKGRECWRGPLDPVRQTTGRSPRTAPSRRTCSPERQARHHARCRAPCAGCSTLPGLGAALAARSAPWCKAANQDKQVWTKINTPPLYFFFYPSEGPFSVQFWLTWW